jgi:hypothetical protein
MESHFTHPRHHKPLLRRKSMSAVKKQFPIRPEMKRLSVKPILAIIAMTAVGMGSWALAGGPGAGHPNRPQLTHYERVTAHDVAQIADGPFYSGDTLTLEADCPEGKLPLGGGADVSHGEYPDGSHWPADEFTVIATFPTSRGWGAKFRNDGEDTEVSTHFWVWAICASGNDTTNSQ